MDSEDVHVDVEKILETPDNDSKPQITQQPAPVPQPLPPAVACTTQSQVAPSTPDLSSAPSVPPVTQAKSPGRSVASSSAVTSSVASSSSTITVLTPTKLHQRVFHTGTKQPVVVLRDFAGRQTGKRKRSPRRGESPKRGFRTRRVSLPMQHHPGFEPCVLAKAKVWLPIDVIEEPFIFNEVVNLDTWDNVLSTKDRERLSEFLPSFSAEDGKEKRECIKRLFGGDNFHFGNHADFLQKKIQSGRLHPEVIKADKLCQKQKYKEYKYRQQRRAHKLLKDVLISRQELLEAAQYTSPHEPIRVKKPRPKPTYQEFDERLATKYRKVLRDVRQDCGDMDTSDEDEKHSSESAVTTKTWLDILSDMYPSHTSVTSVQATTAPKPTPYEMGLTGSPLMSPPASQSDAPLKISDAKFMSMLEKHQRKRNEEEDQFDLDTSSVHLHDVVGRVYSLHRSPAPGASPTFVAPRTPTVHKKKRKDKDKIKKKKKQKAAKLAAKALKMASLSQPPPSPPPAVSGPTPIKKEPQTSLDVKPAVMVKPINQGAPPVKVEVMTRPAPTTQVTPPTSVMTSGFLVLLKEIVMSCPNQSITLQELENRVTAWQRSPASLLCGWLSLEPNWTKVVGHAMRFMSGAIPSGVPVEPRVQFDLATQTWKWIGQGKDSNDQLVHLFKQWLSVNTEEPPIAPEPVESRRVDTVTNIPSPRMKTDYVVRPSNEEEKKQFREQEQRRYEQPHKAFTYYAHGYESVVGPVKGVFGKESSLTKAREHSLLVSERPPYVTILSLVRDAVARLPNGEGTRSEVCELLKDSQFLSLSMDSHLNTVVSGALDRLHYEKDPCVKYDTTRKMWIYLHRNRNELEFERLHKEVAANAKAKKSMPHQRRPVSKVKTIKEQSLSPSPSTILETSNDSIISGHRMETPSPTQSPANTAGINSRLMSPSPVSSMMHQTTPQPASPQIALSGPRHGLPASKQTIQQQILNAQLLRSVLPMSGIQVTAVRTSTTEVPSMAGQHGFVGDGKVDASSGTSLIKAQLLAPRVGQIPVGAQLNPYVSPQQVMLTSEAARGTQMSADLRNQLLAQSLARSFSMPAGIPLSRPPMTSLPGSLPHQVQAQQLAFSLAGARGKAPPQRPPTAADLLKQDLAFQALQAGVQAQAGVGGTPPASSSTVNVTLTLKRAQSMDASHQFTAGMPRQPTNPTNVRMPTVGSLLAGLGMPQGGVPVHTGRTPPKKTRRSKKSSSQTLASLAMQHSNAAIRSPAVGTTPPSVTGSPVTHVTTSQGMAFKEGQLSKGNVVTIQALTRPQMATPSPASLTNVTSSASAAALIAGAMTPAVTATLQHRTSATSNPVGMTSVPSAVPTSRKSTSATATTVTSQVTTTVASSLTPVKTTPATRAPAVRRAAQPKSQKISKMISQPGRVPEVRYSLPAGRKTPPAASHAAAIHRLALQSLAPPVSQATGGKTTATQGMQQTRPQSPKTSGIHVLGSLSKFEEGKSGMATIPMSLLLQGQAMAQSGGLPKGALPMHLSSQLLGNIPVGVAQGKGLIFQMPPGSKLVTAVPVTTSATKSPGHAVVTTAAANTGSKIQTQVSSSVKTPPRQKSPSRSVASAKLSQSPATKAFQQTPPKTASVTPHGVTTSVTATATSAGFQSATATISTTAQGKLKTKSTPTTSTSSKTTNA